MTTIQTRSHVGADGLLRLTLPVDVKDTDLDVTVVVRPVPAAANEPMVNAQWLAFVNETAGAWQGGPLERPDQGETEERDEWA
jgi:hypothetical protein